MEGDAEMEQMDTVCEHQVQQSVEGGRGWRRCVRCDLLDVSRQPSALNDSASYDSTVGKDADAWLASVGQSVSDDVAKFHSYEAAAVVLPVEDMRRLTALVNDFVFEVGADGRWVAGTGHNPHVHADVAWLPVWMPLPVSEHANLRTGRTDPSWVLKAVLDPASDRWFVVKCQVRRLKAAQLAKNRALNNANLDPAKFATNERVYARMEAARAGRILSARGDDQMWFTPEEVHVCSTTEDWGDEDAVEVARQWAAELRDDYLDAESVEYAGFGGMGTPAGVRHSGASAQTWPFSGERMSVVMHLEEADPIARVLDEVDRVIAREWQAEQESADWADLEAEEWAMARDAEWAS